MVATEKQTKQIMKIIKRLAYPKTFIIYNNDAAKFALYREFSNDNKASQKHISYIDLNVFKYLKSHGLISNHHNNKWFINKDGSNYIKRTRFNSDNFRRQHQNWSLSLSENYQMAKTNINNDYKSGEKYVNDNESPLSWLAKRRDKKNSPHFTKAQIMAGEKLRSDFTISNFMPSITTNWNAAQLGNRNRYGNSYENISDHSINAKNNFFSAIKLLEPEIAPIIIDICCFLLKLEEVEQKHSLPVRSGKVVLKIGLSALARHYGYINQRSKDLNISHYGVDGYIPSIK